MTSQRAVGLLVLWALWACSEGDLPREYRRLEVPGDVLESEASRAAGRDLYLENCALCHGERADGRGRRSNLSTPPRDLTDPHWQERTSPRDLFVAIREGKAGTAMPSFRALTDEQIWDLVAYVDSLDAR